MWYGIAWTIWHCRYARVTSVRIKEQSVVASVCPMTQRIRGVVKTYEDASIPRHGRRWPWNIPRWVFRGGCQYRRSLIGVHIVPWFMCEEMGFVFVSAKCIERGGKQQPQSGFITPILIADENGSTQLASSGDSNSKIIAHTHCLNCHSSGEIAHKALAK